MKIKRMPTCKRRAIFSILSGCFVTFSVTLSALTLTLSGFENGQVNCGEKSEQGSVFARYALIFRAKKPSRHQ